MYKKYLLIIKLEILELSLFLKNFHIHFWKKRVWARVILESAYCKSHVLHERVVIVTDRNIVLTTNGRMQFWLPKMDETASFEIWWWRWHATLFELRPSLSSVSHCTPSAWSVWLTNGSNWVSLCYYISNTLEGEKGTSQYFFLVLLLSLSLSLSYFQSKKKMVGTDLRQQLNNYIQSMRDQVSSDQIQFSF